MAVDHAVLDTLHREVQTLQGRSGGRHINPKGRNRVVPLLPRRVQRQVIQIALIAVFALTDFAKDSAGQSRMEVDCHPDGGIPFKPDPAAGLGQDGSPECA
jgi:hypothetical protein